MKANVGRILVGDKELAYCEGIEVNYDAGAIFHYAADRNYPVLVAPGNSKLDISIDCAEYVVTEEYVLQDIFQGYLPVTVQCLAGIRGGGVTGVFTNCVVTGYTVTSRQGDVVKAKVTLSKQADS